MPSGSAALYTTSLGDKQVTGGLDDTVAEALKYSGPDYDEALTAASNAALRDGYHAYAVLRDPAGSGYIVHAATKLLRPDARNGQPADLVRTSPLLAALVERNGKYDFPSATTMPYAVAPPVWSDEPPESTGGWY